MIVVLSSRADANLESIGNWIANDNPLRAVTFVDELYAACVNIGDNPLLHAFVPGSRSLRKTLFAPYAIYYRVRRDHVLIVSIRHGARDNRRLR